MLGRNQQTWTLQAERGVPGAEGKVQVAKADNGNRDLKVEAQHLAPPAAAFPGKNTYVVWLKPENGQPLNIGVLNPDKDRKAELQTSTPFKSFEILVTAENSPTPMQPGNDQVMAAQVQVAS
jgi:hypothetical protein